MQWAGDMREGGKLEAMERVRSMQMAGKREGGKPDEVHRAAGKREGL